MNNGYPFNDFTMSMARLATNVRIDNSISDQSKHYYEYIDEINADGSKTRTYYGRLYTNNNTLSRVPYFAVKDGAIKTDFRDRVDLSELLTVDMDHSKEIGAYKIEYYSPSNSLLRTEQTDFSFTETKSNSISIKDLDLGPFFYTPFIPDNMVANQKKDLWNQNFANISWLYDGLNNITLSSIGYNYGASHDGYIDISGVAKNPLSLLEYESSYYSTAAPWWFNDLANTPVPWGTGTSSGAIANAMQTLHNNSKTKHYDQARFPMSTNVYNWYEDDKHRMRGFSTKTQQSFKLKPIHITETNYF
jgi:hypothetical protein